MSSDEYQVQNVYRYSRKSFKKTRREQEGQLSECPRDTINIEADDGSLRPEHLTCGPPMTSCGVCELETDTEIANILSKKCPVIQLAQRQVEQLLDETDKLGENTRCCRTVYDFLCMCKLVLSREKCRCFFVIIVAFSFATGAIFGAATCGTHLGRFNSPIFHCIDNYFMAKTYPRLEDTYRSIV